MTKNIIYKFAKKGINLSPEAYEKILKTEDPVSFSSSLIVKLKSNKHKKEDLISVSGDIVDKYLNPTAPTTETKPQEKTKPQPEPETIKKPTPTQKTETKPTPIKKEEKPQPTPTPTPKKTEPPKPEPQPEKSKEEQRKEDYIKNNSTKNLMEIEEEAEVSQEFKRNLTKTNINFDKFEILTDTTGMSYTSGEVNNIIEYFNSRYNKLTKIIEKHPEMKAHQKIADIGENQTDLNLIVMVNEIKTTKNGNNIVEFEDDTGQITVLFSNKNEEAFNLSQKLIKDEVVGVVADKKDRFSIGNNIIYPGIPRMSQPNSDCGIVFTSDIHIGSVTFLEDAFVKFIKWINGDYGNEEQRKIANNVKYLTIDGDLVDGIGIYPNQDKELAIPDIREQYEEAARLLGDIRSDVKIIICPGNHDATRLAEPQPAIPEKYAKSLHQLNNVEFISNPGYVNLDGTKVLMYHGRGMDDLAIGVKGFSHERNDLIMEELLNIRHLSPIYGERSSVASEQEDYLVIDDIPNVLHTGHVHINTYKYYKGVHLINSGTFQTQTEYQKIYNIVPTPAQVPILDNGEYKQLKFR